MPFEPPAATQRLEAIGLVPDKNPRQGLFRVDQSSMAHYSRKQNGDTRFRADLKTLLQPTAGCFCCLKKPRHGEWLAWAPEPGQTFAQYALSDPNRASRERSIIYVLPLTLAGRGGMATPAAVEPEPEPEAAPPCEQMGGTLPPLEPLVQLVQAYYQLQVRVLPPLLLSKLRASRRGGDTADTAQYDGASILTALRKRVPPDAHTLCAVTMADIYSGDLNFVFGLHGAPEESLRPVRHH